MAQLVCGGCHTLLMYICGATGVQCSCCRTFNLALEGSANVRVGLAHQQVPFNVPHCIARFLKEWNVGPKRTVQDQRSRGSWAAKSNIWGDSDSNKNPEEKDTHGVWNRTSYNTNSDGWGGQDSKDAAGGNTNSDVWGSQNRKEFHAKRSVEIGGMSAKSDVWGSQVSKEANIEKSSDTGGWNANIMPDQLNQQPKATGWGSTRSPGFSWISDQSIIYFTR